MNLSYTLPKAEENILAGVKLHTLREDRGNRWKAGMKIHHSYSFRSKGGYSCFFVNECKSVQSILIVLASSANHELLTISVERKVLSNMATTELILKDGFDNWFQFVDWFFQKTKTA